MRHKLVTALTCLALFGTLCNAQAQRQTENFDEGWRFHFGNAADPAKDFGSGTEYFNYLTKAASIHNEGPYCEKFVENDWKSVTLPHDFVVDLPFDEKASHSHGYKQWGISFLRPQWDGIERHSTWIKLTTASISNCYLMVSSATARCG